MAKFKVGDKVRVIDFKENPPHWSRSGGMDKWKGKTVTLEKITRTNVTSDMEFSLREDRGEFLGHKWVWKSSDFEPVETRREFIVIRRDGAKTIAELRHDREIIKSGTAICNASDTFDFDTGAKLAFDRLMGREEPKPAPAPEPPKYYTGKVVCISGEYGIGKVFTVRNGFFTDGDYNCPDKPYKSVDDMNSRFLFGKFAALKE